MIELQVINKILNDGNLEFLKKNGFKGEDFIQFKDEINFILDFYKQYNKVPSRETFIDNFNDFEFIDTPESEDYLVDKFREENLYNEFLPILKKVADLMKDNSFDAYNFLKGRIPDLNVSLKNPAIGVMSTSILRADSLKKRAYEADHNFISTGLKSLDDIIFGWNKGEELATIVGRPGQGKSWLTLLFLVSAWKQGLTVGLYSGEMSEESVGYRIDTLLRHFSNQDLVRGTLLDIKEYDKYIEEISKSKNEFFVLTPANLKRRATVSDLEDFIDTNKIDILGVDQFSLLQDERASKRSDTREELEHLSMDLFNLSTKKHIPILAVSQSNRMGAKNEKEKGTPDIENIYGSDSIAQNSTKILTLRQKDDKFEISIKKNRYGMSFKNLEFRWDIEHGILEEIQSEEEINKNLGQTYRVLTSGDDPF